MVPYFEVIKAFLNKKRLTDVNREKGNYGWRAMPII
jgi:hypothetical protein